MLAWSRLLPILTVMLIAAGAVRAQAPAQPTAQAPQQAPQQGPSPGASAPAVPRTENPAEGKSYVAAVETRDAARRAQALEIFIAWYPNSILRVAAYEQLMAAWQAANSPDKADAVAAKLLQIEPDNLRALANRVYVGRTRVASGDNGALAPTVAAAERGLAVLARWQRPQGLDENEFTRTKLQFGAVFNGMLGFAALQAKDYARARRQLADAVAVDHDNLQDVYQLSVALLEGTPVDALGFWYGARAVAIARAGKNDQAAASIEKYVRSRYQRYHGSEDGFDAVLARAASARVAPDRFSTSISRQLTPEEKAVQLANDSEPGSLSFADWARVLTHRDASAENRAAAERVWKAIGEKQRGGEVRLKIPIKVLKSTAERVEGAITDENQASRTPDLEVRFMRPLSPMPAVDSQISVIGTLSEYRPKPFSFIMINAELAPESLPVAGGPCAEPRPQMCTRDYRPACGLRRDNSRKTYSNACSACADSDVVSQSAGACP